MCQFISWIEKGDKIYYLTSENLASKRGKQLIKYTQAREDLVGHGAIRWFYGEFEGGVEKECNDFSSPSNFPPKIVEDIKHGKFKGMGICRETLTPSALEEYERMERNAHEEYERIERNACEEYKRIERDAYEEYKRIERDAYEEYESIELPLYKWYMKIKQSAYEGYMTIKQAAYEKYNSIERFAREEYHKIQQTTYEEFEKIRKKAFWEIFSDPKNRKEEWR